VHKFWVTNADRQLQIQILGALIALSKSQTSPKPSIKITRPKVLTEDQLEDIAEQAAISNGKNIHYESE
jgi:hypothetical protein